MPEQDVPPLSEDELTTTFRRLEELLDDPSVVIIGGAALSFWHAQLATAPASPQLATSDVDLQGGTEAVLLAGELLGGQTHIAKIDDHTPNTGAVAFHDSAGDERVLDFLGAPHGLDAEDVRKRAIPVDVVGAGRVYVMNPMDCLRSRVANFSLPGRNLAHALAQLCAAIELVPRYGRLMLEEEIPVREVTNLNEAVYELALYNRNAKSLAIRHGIEVADAVLYDDRLPSKHLEIRLPLLKAQLDTERVRLARAWHARLPSRYVESLSAAEES